MNNECKPLSVVQRGHEWFIRIGNEWFRYDQRERPLGSGAMGTVYLGRSCQTNECVAIKRVVDQYACVPAIRDRARLEASLLFRHRNLIEMVGYCEADPNQGPIFIVSKLVQGITLDRHVNNFLRSRADAVKRICESIYPVLDALTYLHGKGIVHMDIKPSNIMVENGCNIRLMDLGIATTHSDLGINAPGLVGTPKYAAPEQIYEAGKPQPQVDATTDLYELGITLYELLTGFNPFDSSSREETILKQKTLVLPESKSIPKPLLRVLRKATEKSQAARFQTAAAFKNAIQQALIQPRRIVWPWIVAGAISILALLALISANL